MTRHKLFVTCLEEYFKYSNVNDDYDLVWNIHQKTKNNLNFHEYEMVFPKYVVDYVVDASVDSMGCLVESETVFREQGFPQIVDFIADFKKYFNPYIFLKNGVKESFVDIRHNMLDGGGGGLTYNITVKYVKNYLPFPNATNVINNEYVREKLMNVQSSLLDYEDKIDEMTHIIRSLEQKNRNLRKHANRSEQQVYQLMKVMHKMYDETDKRQECPICYETIIPTKLTILECSHSLCSECCEKCTKCPICRHAF